MRFRCAARATGANCRRFCRSPARSTVSLRLPATDGEARFLPLEELLLLNVGALFPGYELAGSCTFRLLRDSDLELEEEAEDLVREFETALKRRRRGEVVRLQISAGAPQDLKTEIIEQLHVAGDEIVDVKGMIGLVSLKETGAGRPAGPAVEVLHAPCARAGAGP